MRYDIALVKKWDGKGLTIKDCENLFGKLSRKNGYPFEIARPDGDLFAFGFITYKAIGRAGLEEFIQSLLTTAEDGSFEYDGLKIWLG